MRVRPRLLAVLVFLAVGMLALVVAGLLDWIVGVLFLSMEFLGEVLRNVFKREREKRKHPPTRSLRPAAGPLRSVEQTRRFGRRRGRPRRRRPASTEDEPSPPAPHAEPRMRILVPVTGDDPDLIAYALEECRARQAELILLFLRPIAVIPMGPTPLPGLAEDDDARATFDRVAEEAARLAVPLQTRYQITADRPATIGVVARDCKADVVLVGSARKNGLAGFLARDPNPALLRFLPEHASLTIHAS